MQYFKHILLALVSIILITACSKKEDKLIDDTRYIIDNYVILMLCKVPEQESHRSLMTLLKGNEDSIIGAINTLQEMDQTVDVKNALVVAYLRLRKFKEANENFQMALNLAESSDEKAFIYKNISLMYTAYDLNKALDYSNKSIEALEKWQKQDHYDMLDLHEVKK